MKILIVDDSDLKIAKIKTVIYETDKSPEFLVAKNKADAMTLIRSNPLIDLMILDLNLPNRKGENAKRLAGLSFLKELNRRDSIAKPNHIIGLTAYSELKNEVRSEFEQNGWVVVTYNTANGDWEETIKNKIDYISSNKGASSTSNEETENTDFALIMKGGGIKGLAYVGALEELSKHYKFNWYAGTSAGAISAILLAAGYNYKELDKILKTKNFNDFKDANFIVKFFNLIFKGGFYKADNFRKWIGDLLSEKLESSTEVKLKDLPFRASVYATTKGKKALIYDSLDDKTNTNFASFAARCSMSIPFIFIPQKNNGYNVFDGGAQNNYPVEILLKDNPNTKFIGLYLGEEFHTIKKQKYIFSELIEIWTESNDVEALEQYKDETIIIDPNPISTLKFTLNKDEKEFLLECGRLGALKFLAKNDKIVLDDNDFNERKNKLEKKREELKIKVRKKKRRSKIILWSLAALMTFTLIWNWSNMFPPNATTFNAKFEIKDTRNDKISIENGIIRIEVGGNNYYGEINSQGVAIVENIPIEYAENEVDDVEIENSNPNLIYLSIDDQRKHKIDKFSKGFKTQVQVFLKGSDTLSGKVIDSINGHPLEGVKISIKNKTVAHSNLEGKYGFKIPLELVPKAKESITIIYSKEGYKDQSSNIIMPRLLDKDIILINN